MSRGHLVTSDVGALSGAESTELASTVEASFLRELGHALGELEVDLTGHVLQLTVVEDILLQLVQGALETRVEVDLVSVEEERRLQGRFGVEVLLVVMLCFKVVSPQKLGILQLLDLTEPILECLLLLVKLLLLLLSHGLSGDQLGFELSLGLINVGLVLLLSFDDVPELLSPFVAVVMHELASCHLIAAHPTLHLDVETVVHEVVPGLL